MTHSCSPVSSNYGAFKDSKTPLQVAVCVLRRAYSATETISSSVSAVWTVTAISCDNPAILQACTAKGQIDMTWTIFLCAELQLTQLVGQWTPLSCNRTRVGRQPRHMCQTKFFTFGGTFNFQIADQSPGLWRWDVPSIMYCYHILATLSLKVSVLSIFTYTNKNWKNI